MLELMQVVRGEAKDRVFTRQKVELKLENRLIKIEPLRILYTTDKSLSELLSALMSDGEINTLCAQINELRSKTKRVAIILAEKAVKAGDNLSIEQMLKDIGSGKIDMDAVIAEHEAEKKAEKERLENESTGESV